MYISSTFRLYIISLLHVVEEASSSLDCHYHHIDSDMACLFYCNRCERSFKWKVSFERHQKRKTPCRKATYSCSDCGNFFVSQQSLIKHKNSYCKYNVVLSSPSLPSSLGKQVKEADITAGGMSNTQTPCIPLDGLPPHHQDDCNELLTPSGIMHDVSPAAHPSLDNTSSTLQSTSMSDLFNHLWDDNLQCWNGQAVSEDNKHHVPTHSPATSGIGGNDDVAMSPPTVVDPRKPRDVTHDAAATATIVTPSGCQHQSSTETSFEPSAVHDDVNNVLRCFDEVLVAWMDEILRLEGKIRSNAMLKEEVARVIDRMLQDGLISTHEHDHMSETNKLFVRLHDLIHLKTYTPDRKREIMDILIRLFEIGRLARSAFIELLCINI